MKKTFRVTGFGLPQLFHMAIWRFDFLISKATYQGQAMTNAFPYLVDPSDPQHYFHKVASGQIEKDGLPRFTFEDGHGNPLATGPAYVNKLECDKYGKLSECGLRNIDEVEFLIARHSDDYPNGVPVCLLHSLDDIPVRFRRSWALTRESEHGDLFLGCVGEANDTTRRLVFADWLEEHDHEEAAKLIRIACSPQAKGVSYTENFFCELATIRYWQRFLDGFQHHAYLRRSFDKGLPTRLSADHHKFRKMVEHTDWCRDLVCCTKFSTRFWIKHPHCLGHAMQFFGARQAAAPHSAAFVSILVNNPLVAGLTELDFDLAVMKDAGAEAIANSPHLQRLDVLAIERAEITDRGAIALAHSPYLHKLRSLSLLQNQITDTGFKELATSPGLQSILLLDLSSNRLTDEAMSALAASPHLRKLKVLLINNNRITDEGARTLASSPYLPDLEALEVFGNTLTDAGKAALLCSPHLPKLRAERLKMVEVGT